MKRYASIFKAVAATVGMILLIAVIFSKVIFSNDRLTALVLPKISQILNRDVSAEQVELSFFPTIGIRITGLRVSNPSYQKFYSPYLLDTKAVVIDAKILPLLKNRLEINNVIFYSPTIFIEQNAKGRLNTDHLLSESLNRGQKNIRESLSSLLLSNFEIANGNIILYNNKSDISVKFLNVDLTSRIQTVVEENKLVLNSKFNIESFEFWKGNSDLFKGNSINVNAKLDYDTRYDVMNIQSTKASVFGIKLKSNISLSFYPRTDVNAYMVNTDSSAQGVYNLLPGFLQDEVFENSVNGKLALGFEYTGHNQITTTSFLFQLKNFRAELHSGDTLSIKSLNAEYFSRNDSSNFMFSMPGALLGDNFASVAFNITPPKTADAKVSANINLNKLAHSLGLPEVDKFSGSLRAKYNLDINPKSGRVNANGLVTFADALVRIPIGIDTLYNGECDGSISFRNNRAIFDKMLLRLGASDIVLTGTLTDYPSIFLGEKSLMPSAKMQLVSKTFSTVGLLPHLNLNIGRQFLIWLPRANVQLKFNMNKFVMPTDTLSGVSGNLQLQEFFVRMNKLNYSSSMGTFEVVGWTDYGQEGKTNFSFKAKISTTDFGNLIRRYLGKDEIEGGAGKGSLTLNGTYDDSGKVDLATIGGRGQFRISNISMKDYSVLDKLYAFLGESRMDELKLSDASFSVDLTDGRVYFDDLEANGTPFNFRLDGWHGFDGTLDYKLALRIHPPVSVKVAQYLKSSYPDLAPSIDGSLGLDLVAGGTTNDARFTIISFNTKLTNSYNGSESANNSLLSLK